jgi:hypothetical protein
MKLLYKIFILILIPSIIFGCTVIKQCYHGGVFSNKTCSCECFAAYTG